MTGRTGFALRWARVTRRPWKSSFNPGMIGAKTVRTTRAREVMTMATPFHGRLQFPVDTTAEIASQRLPAQTVADTEKATEAN